MDLDINELLQKTCKGHDTYINYNGCLLTERYKRIADQIDNFKVNNSDIWVTSFPKCGTTWLQEMVYLIATDCDYENAKSYITDRFPFLEFDASKPSKFECSVNSVQNVINCKDNPRMIKTHLPYFLLPKSIQLGQSKPKILHVTRNPRDACVSYYHHYIANNNYKGNFDEFCELFLAEKLLYTPFWVNVLSYWKKRHDTNILFVKYEDMKTDLRSVIIKVASFLDKSLADQQIDDLLQHLDFDCMKNNVAVNYEPFFQDSNFKQMRKGIVGDYVNVMSDEIIRKFNEWITKNDPGIFNN